MIKNVRFKITDRIGITKPRIKDKKCIICDQLIKNYSVILYMNHGKDRVFAWLHFGCLDRLEPSNIREKFYSSSHSRNIIHSERAGCSYCGVVDKDLPLENYTIFFLHKECKSKLIDSVKKIIKDNEEMFVLDAL